MIQSGTLERIPIAPGDGLFRGDTSSLGRLSNAAEQVRCLGRRAPLIFVKTPLIPPLIVAVLLLISR
jgi:hypothetical protein